MNVIAKGIIGATMMAAFGLTHAAGPIYYTVNGGATQQLDLAPITDTFVGTTTVRAGICSLPCTFTATGTLSDDLVTTTLAVTSASSSGSFACNTVSLSGFPWVGSVPHDDIPSPLGPVTFSLSGVNVVSLCGTCSDTIDVTFDPANGGSFRFNGPIYPKGSCSVQGNLTPQTGNYYEAWH